MINLFEKLLNLIYYRRCYTCGIKTESEFICNSCYSKIKFINATVNRPDINCPVYVCGVYENVMKKIILGIKYFEKQQLADFCSFLAVNCLKSNSLERDYIVIPVPVHKNRKKQRKYNHMDIIADAFCRKTGLKPEKNLIIRIKDTDRQFHLDTKQRMKNIRDAFQINEKLKQFPDKKRPVLILDDIISSGTTVNELVSVLKAFGYSDISALVLSMPELKH